MKNIYFAITGAIGEAKEAIPIITELMKDYSVHPVASDYTRTCIKDILDRLSFVTGFDALSTIAEAERVAPMGLSDALVIYPCTGNTLAKIANAISDSTVPYLAKGHMRNNLPIVIGLSTNDALGLNMYNLARLMNTKNIYFVPLYQDDPENKPHSLKCDKTKIITTLQYALENKQIQPVVISSPDT